MQCQTGDHRVLVSVSPVGAAADSGRQQKSPECRCRSRCRGRGRSKSCQKLPKVWRPEPSVCASPPTSCCQAQVAMISLRAARPDDRPWDDASKTRLASCHESGEGKTLVLSGRIGAVSQRHASRFEAVTSEAKMRLPIASCVECSLCRARLCDRGAEVNSAAAWLTRLHHHAQGT